MPVTAKTELPTLRLPAVPIRWRRRNRGDMQPTVPYWPLLAVQTPTFWHNNHPGGEMHIISHMPGPSTHIEWTIAVDERARVFR
jgi:hypothetical protein